MADVQTGPAVNETRREGNAQSQGTERERQVRQTASELGVADFVYTQRVLRKGAASREASGDGLLIVGERGAVLQVKSRDDGAAASDTPEKTDRWLGKELQRAVRQGRGTRRELARRLSGGERVAMRPARALGLPDEEADIYELELLVDPSHWPIIVILDHPVETAFNPYASGPPIGDDVVVLTKSDWEQLYRRIRSVAGMITYVQRVLDAQARCTLGAERDRYEAFYEADAAYDDSQAGTVPSLLHPDAADDLGLDLFNDLMEYAWRRDGWQPGYSADRYREIVEFLDGTPATIRASTGRWIFQKRRAISDGALRRHGGCSLISADRLLVYLCGREDDYESNERFVSELALMTTVRLSQALESGAPADLQALGVGVLCEGSTPGVTYSYVLMREAEPVPRVLRTHVELIYGRFDWASRSALAVPEPQRNEPCVCGSGRKYKVCCS